jgi:hypothetical protein
VRKIRWTCASTALSPKGLTSCLFARPTGAASDAHALNLNSDERDLLNKYRDAVSDFAKQDAELGNEVNAFLRLRSP